jgi:hypothetical protein
MTFKMVFGALIYYAKRFSARCHHGLEHSFRDLGVSVARVDWREGRAPGRFCVSISAIVPASKAAHAQHLPPCLFDGVAWVLPTLPRPQRVTRILDGWLETA